MWKMLSNEFPVYVLAALMNCGNLVEKRVTFPQGIYTCHCFPLMAQNFSRLYHKLFHRKPGVFHNPSKGESFFISTFRKLKLTATG